MEQRSKQTNRARGEAEEQEQQGRKEEGKGDSSGVCNRERGLFVMSKSAADCENRRALVLTRESLIAEAIERRKPIKPPPMPYVVEQLCRALCRDDCHLVQCDTIAGFCPYWRSRESLSRAALRCVGIAALDLPKEVQDTVAS